jgi:hypothetical protein
MTASAVGIKGIDCRQTGTALIFEGFLQTSAGALVTSGTTSLYIWQQMSDGSILTYDFASNTFKSTAVTTETASLTYRKSNNSSTDTGYWTYALTTLSGFTIGANYRYRVNNSGASPTDQLRGFLYGAAEGDLLVTAAGAGEAYLQSDVENWTASAPGVNPAAAITAAIDAGAVPCNYPVALLVTGETAPDVTGAYFLNGNQFQNGYPCYRRFDDAYLIQWDGELEVIVDASDDTELLEGSAAAGWPIGSYSAINPATGSCTVSPMYQALDVDGIDPAGTAALAAAGVAASAATAASQATIAASEATTAATAATIAVSQTIATAIQTAAAAAITAQNSGDGFTANNPTQITVTPISVQVPGGQLGSSDFTAYQGLASEPWVLSPTDMYKNPITMLGPVKLMIYDTASGAIVDSPLTGELSNSNQTVTFDVPSSLNPAVAPQGTLSYIIVDTMNGGANKIGLWEGNWIVNPSGPVSLL